MASMAQDNALYQAGNDVLVSSIDPLGVVDIGEVSAVGRGVGGDDTGDLAGGEVDDDGSGGEGAVEEDVVAGEDAVRRHRSGWADQSGDVLDGGGDRDSIALPCPYMEINVNARRLFDRQNMDSGAVSPLILIRLHHSRLACPHRQLSSQRMCLQHGG